MTWCLFFPFLQVIKTFKTNTFPSILLAPLYITICLYEIALDVLDCFLQPRGKPVQHVSQTVLEKEVGHVCQSVFFVISIFPDCYWDVEILGGQVVGVFKTGRVCISEPVAFRLLCSQVLDEQVDCISLVATGSDTVLLHLTCLASSFSHRTGCECFSWIRAGGKCILLCLSGLQSPHFLFFFYTPSPLHSVCIDWPGYLSVWQPCSSQHTSRIHSSFLATLSLLPLCRTALELLGWSLQYRLQSFIVSSWYSWKIKMQLIPQWVAEGDFFCSWFSSCADFLPTSRTLNMARGFFLLSDNTSSRSAETLWPPCHPPSGPRGIMNSHSVVLTFDNNRVDFAAEHGQSAACRFSIIFSLTAVLLWPHHAQWASTLWHQNCLY